MCVCVCVCVCGLAIVMGKSILIDSRRGIEAIIFDSIKTAVNYMRVSEYCN